MWYQKTKNGKYQFFERYKLNGKYKVTSIVMPARTPKYKAMAQSVLSERIKGFLRQDDKESVCTVKSLYDAYIEWEYANLKEQTAVNNKRKLKTAVERLGDVLIKDMTPSIYKEAMDAPAVTYNERLTRFKAMMRWGYANEYISDISFVDRLKPKKDLPTRVKVQDKFLERDDLKKLIDAAIPKWASLIEFLALTGMRIGEVIDLRNTDIDYEKRLISVNSTYSSELKKSSSTKTETSEREIYIQEELLDCLNRIEKGRVFLFEEDGKRIAYDTFRIYLSRLSKKVLGRSISPHYFRHTHTALLAEAGVPLGAISQRLGHADSKVTRRVYLHITERAKEKENKRLDLIHLL